MLTGQAADVRKQTNGTGLRITTNVAESINRKIKDRTGLNRKSTFFEVVRKMINFIDEEDVEMWFGYKRQGRHQLSTRLSENTLAKLSDTTLLSLAQQSLVTIREAKNKENFVALPSLPFDMRTLFGKLSDADRSNLEHSARLSLQFPGTLQTNPDGSGYML